MVAGALTPEAVQDALKSVLERGEYPSMAKIRGELGSTASQQTLTRHMKAAWQGLAEQMGTGLPEGLPRSVVDAAHRFYTEARDSAREELEKQRALMQEREDALKQNLDETRQRAEGLAKQVDQLQQRAEQADLEVASLSQQLSDSQAQLADSQGNSQRVSRELDSTRRETAQRLRQMRIEHRRRVQALIGERDQMASARDREIERADSQQKAWATEIDRARQATREAEAAAEQQAMALRDERDRAITQRDTNAQSVRDKAGEIQKLIHELEANREHLEAAEQGVQQAGEANATLTAQLASAQSDHNRVNEQLIRMTALAQERDRLLARVGQDREVENKPRSNAPKDE